MKYALLGAVLGLLFVMAFRSAHGSAPYARDAKLQRCMVYLPAMRDAKLRRWCMKQSERMP